MATTTSGLTRRRGGGAATNGGEDEASRVSSPVPKRNDDRAPETSYENSANGHKIAFDPRDISESAERNKQPKLTLMEEVILMGLKDKQVRAGNYGGIRWADHGLGIPFFLERQHLLRASGVYSHRTRLPWPHKHAKGFIAPKVSSC